MATLRLVLVRGLRLVLLGLLVVVPVVLVQLVLLEQLLLELLVEHVLVPLLRFEQLLVVPEHDLLPGLPLRAEHRRRRGRRGRAERRARPGRADRSRWWREQRPAQQRQERRGQEQRSHPREPGPQVCGARRLLLQSGALRRGRRCLQQGPQLRAGRCVGAFCARRRRVCDGRLPLRRLPDRGGTAARPEPRLGRDRQAPVLRRPEGLRRADGGTRPLPRHQALRRTGASRPRLQPSLLRQEGSCDRRVPARARDRLRESRGPDLPRRALAQGSRRTAQGLSWRARNPRTTVRPTPARRSRATLARCRAESTPTSGTVSATTSSRSTRPCGTSATPRSPRTCCSGNAATRSCPTSACAPWANSGCSDCRLPSS